MRTYNVETDGYKWHRVNQKLFSGNGGTGRIKIPEREIRRRRRRSGKRCDVAVRYTAAAPTWLRGCLSTSVYGVGGPDESRVLRFVG